MLMSFYILLIDYAMNGLNFSHENFEEGGDKSQLFSVVKVTQRMANTRIEIPSVWLLLQ